MNWNHEMMDELSIEFEDHISDGYGFFAIDSGQNFNNKSSESKHNIIEHNTRNNHQFSLVYENNYNISRLSSFYGVSNHMNGSDLSRPDNPMFRILLREETSTETDIKSDLSLFIDTDVDGSLTDVLTPTYTNSLLMNGQNDVNALLNNSEKRLSHRVKRISFSDSIQQFCYNSCPFVGEDSSPDNGRNHKRNRVI